MGITKLITSKNDSLIYTVSLQEVLDSMINNKTKHIVLINEQKPVGIITERDVLFLYTKHTDFSKRAINYARTELITTKDNRKSDYVLGLMLNYGIRRVIITNSNNIYTGCITQEDLIFEFEQDVYKSHIKIEDILKTGNEALYVNIDATIQDAIDIMSEKNIGSILIYKDNKPHGIITESDIIDLAQKNIDSSSPIKEYMHAPLISFDKNELLYDVVKTMKNKNIRRVLINNPQKNLFYVITSKDILNNIKGNYSLFLESKLNDLTKTFDSLNEAVIELYDDNKNGQIIHWFNKKANELFNLSIDNSISSFIPKKQWDNIYTKIKENNTCENEILELNDNIYQLTIIQSKILENSIIKLLFTNISEIVNSNKEIQNKFYETFEQRSIGIIHMDLNHHIIDANSKICSLLGYEKDDLLHQNILDLTYYEDIQKTISSISKLLLNKEEKYYSLEKRCIKKDGSLLWVNVTNSLSFDDKGNPLYFSCYIMDITEQVDLKEELISSNEKFKILYEEVPYPYQSLDEKGIITDVNKKWLETTGYLKQDVIGKKFSSFCADDFEILKNKFKNFLKTKTIKDEKIKLIKKDGDTILTNFEGRISTSNGQLRTHCIFKDITEKEKLEKKLKLSNIVFENTTEAIMIANEKNEIISVNNAFSEITQYKIDEIYGKNPSILSSGRHSRAFYKNLWEELNEKGFYKGEIWNRKKNGEAYAEWLNISLVRDNEGKVLNYVALFSDITKVKDSANKIEYLAHHDPLTDLPNRLLLNARLNKSLEEAEKEHKGLAVIFIDIDNFKIINDTYGHSIGDKIINLVAKRLKKNIRENDTIARIGGDEFILVIEDILERKDIEKLCRKMIKEFKEPIKLQEYLFDITISLGISVYPQNGLNSEDLIKHADTAMYSAKNAGKNQYQFYKQQMTSEIFEKVIMRKEIKDAIDNKEFKVYYQPQIDIKTKEIIGAEALIRWDHQSLGMIPPDSFIPHAEDTKLIIPIGEFVLDEACSFMKKLHSLNLVQNGKIAVNVSGEQIKHSNILKTVNKCLEKNKLDASSLEIEVTETFIMEDVDKSISILNDLKDIGVKLSIDDFGTGYSSLSYIKQFPIDKLKIDKSFIDELPYSQEDIAIAKTVIALAKGLKIKTIAEGVETNEQQHFLEDEDCDEIQGWVYSKALAQNEFIDFVKNYNQTLS